MWVVGVGPGDPAYVTQQAAALIEGADVVAGFNLPLETARGWIKNEAILLDYKNQEERLAVIGRLAAEGRRCVVCAQGDASFSGRELVQRVHAVWPAVEVVPGISSIQVVCVRAGLEMERALFLTFHKRGDTSLELHELVEAARAAERHIVVLPRPWDFMPQQIAALLLKEGVARDRPATVYQRLTLPDESVEQSTLTVLAWREEQFSDLSILLLPLPSHRLPVIARSPTQEGRPKQSGVEG